ncbi:ubiquitin-specific protease ubp2, partial [Ascosphaera acerosa]
CAIKPEGIAPDGEQEDLVKSLFYGKTKTFINSRSGLRSQEELFNDIKINVASGPQNIYSALDDAHDFQTVSIDGGQAEQYATLSLVPPILQIQVQRAQYDSQTGATFKSNHHLDLEEVLYLDRYLDCPDKGLIERRRKVRAMKDELAAIKARRGRLVDVDDGCSVIEALRAARQRLLELQDCNGTLLSCGTAALSHDADQNHIADLENMTQHELLAIDARAAELSRSIKHEFDDQRRFAYRLYAVFIHSGQAAYGHYWIYIHDFDKGLWRKYNDEYVTEVSDDSEIYKEDPRGIANPYLLVYVREDLKNDMVRPVVRDMSARPRGNSPLTADTSRESESAPTGAMLNDPGSRSLSDPTSDSQRPTTHDKDLHMTTSSSYTIMHKAGGLGADDLSPNNPSLNHGSGTYEPHASTTTASDGSAAAPSSYNAPAMSNNSAMLSDARRGFRPDPAFGSLGPNSSTNPFRRIASVPHAQTEAPRSDHDCARPVPGDKPPCERRCAQGTDWWDTEHAHR